MIQPWYFSGINNPLCCWLSRHFHFSQLNIVWNCWLTLFNNVHIKAAWRIEKHTQVPWWTIACEIGWSPPLMDIFHLLLRSSRAVMTRCSFLLSFKFRRLSFTHIYQQHVYQQHNMQNKQSRRIYRHTAHTIVSWPNHKQWVIVHTSQFMMIMYLDDTSGNNCWYIHKNIKDNKPCAYFMIGTVITAEETVDITHDISCIQKLLLINSCIVGRHMVMNVSQNYRWNAPQLNHRCLWS